MHDGNTMEPPPDALRAFRHSLYECFHRRRDALFELADAILTADGGAPPPPTSASRGRTVAVGAASTLPWMTASTPKPSGSLWPAIRSLAPSWGSRPSTRWTRACGLGAMQNAAPSEGYLRTRLRGNGTCTERGTDRWLRTLTSWLGHQYRVRVPRRESVPGSVGPRMVAWRSL